MTTNETPYRPQIDDKVKFIVDTQYGIGLVTSIINDRCQVYCGGVWIIADASQLELISRADGVPVESAKVDLQKEIDELVVESAQMRSRVRALTKENGELAAFKAYVHRRFDDAGVAADPESPHKAAGCRIGGRMDVFIGERDELRKELAEAKSVLTNFATWSDDQCAWNDAGVRARAIASAFLARHQPPSAVDTQQVNHE